jgi:hypothetical protein
MPSNIVRLIPKSSPLPVAKAEKDHSAWLIPWLDSKGHLEGRKAVWAMWPPLQTASLKLARLMGQDLKGPGDQPIVGELVGRAIANFRMKRSLGAPPDRAAASYLEVLLESGEIVVTNRVEAASPNQKADVLVWDPSSGPYGEWADRLPEDYLISSYPIRADEGEYMMGKYLIASQIMTPAEAARLLFRPQNSGLGVL